jgi:hypothetical protein
MKMNARTLLPGLALGLLVAFSAGCSDEGSGTNDPGQAAPAKKGDCPDCDEAGPGAFVQAGIASRFYAPGDTWQVAWQFHQRADMSKAPTLNVDEDELALGPGPEAARSVSEVFLFDYAVTGVSRRVFPIEGGAGVQREVATVEIVPGAPSGTAHPEVFSAQEIGRFEHKFVFEMNDLLEPVAETLFNRQYPNGLRIEVDSVSRLQTGSSLFPHTVPRVLVQPGYEPGAAIEMSPEVEAAADAFAPGWRDRTYRKYTFEDLGEAEGRRDVVYWADGELWPFYVRSLEGQGVLIASSGL